LESNPDLDEETIRAAHLSRRILLAESPDRTWPLQRDQRPSPCCKSKEESASLSRFSVQLLLGPLASSRRNYCCFKTRFP